MTPLISKDGLIVTQEGANVRARSGRVVYVYEARSAADVFNDYLRIAEQAREFYHPKLRELAPGELSEEEFSELVTRTALSCMRYKNKIENQSKGETWLIFCQKYGRSSPEAMRAASVMAGVAQHEIEGIKRFEDIW